MIGGGRALAHHEGETWMVGGALPGELVRAAVTRRRAGIVEARTEAVRSHPHPARLDDPCPQTGVCGGCDWPHVDPFAGADLKVAAAAEAARAHPNLAQRISSAPVHRSESGYRLRARLHWDGSRKTLGFYEQRTRTVVSVAPCRILSPGFMAALPYLKNALAQRCAEHVDVEWLEGSVPGSAVAALRPAKGGVGAIDREWLPEADEIRPHAAGFHALTKKGRLHHGWGATEVRIELPVPLEVPIGAFFQGNRHLIGPLFERVAELVGPEPLPVFDLHAGVGYLAAAARFAATRELTLVEPHRVAASAAARNLPDATIVAGSTAESFVADQAVLPRRSLVITDPPRIGLSIELRRRLASWRPARILMLGCDPSTWARDAGFLCEHGYQPTVVEVFDLFPSTHHLEIVALLEGM
jgi:tRNA/tmRNA/rRNA uracil-C5-methylase (TrmA/RlmC/RlmD family)